MGKQREGESYRCTLETAGPFNYHDVVGNHAEPIVEGLFDGISLSDACGGTAPRFQNVQD